MPNIINPNCPSLPQQVEKNTQDILKLFASNLEELTGLDFIPNNLIYREQKFVISGKFIVIRDENSNEIDGVVSIPFVGENGVIVDGSEDNTKIRISLDQSDRDLFDYVQELINRTTDSDEVVFTSDMENFVSESLENIFENELIYDKDSDDININLGFTSGVSNGISINKDFSKYKFIDATIQDSNDIQTTFRINLTINGIATSLGLMGLNLDAYDRLGVFSSKIVISADRQTLTPYIENKWNGGFTSTYGSLINLRGYF